jgi:K+-transporting ATPase KdpF subunit
MGFSPIPYVDLSEVSPCSIFSLSPQAVRWWLSPSLTLTPATASEERFMSLDYALGAIVAVGIFLYLVYALVRPERF